MANPYYRRVCAWCKKVLDEGDGPHALTTHTICEECDRKQQEKADKEDAENRFSEVKK